MKVIVGKAEYLAHLKSCRADIREDGLYMVSQKDGALYASNEPPIRSVGLINASWQARANATWVHVTTLAPFAGWHTLIMSKKTFEDVVAAPASPIPVEKAEELLSVHELYADDPSKLDIYLAKSFVNKVNDAAGRKLDFNLTLNFWQDLHKEGQICPVTLTPMVVRKMSGGERPNDTLTIERLNPRKGYVMGNVVAMSHGANSAKSAVDMLIHSKKLDDASKVRILRKALYQLEKEIKENAKADSVAPACS